MGLLTRSISRAIGGALARTNDTTMDALNWADWAWSTPTAAGVHVNQASAMQVSSVFACVTILSYDLAKLGASIFLGQRPHSFSALGERSKTPRKRATNHPLYPLFQKPAPWLTWFEFAGMMQAALLLRGNAYAVILRNGRGVPYMLVPINPDRVALWEAPDGELFYMVTRSGLHEMAILAGQPLLIHIDDIFHLKALTLNGLLGLSPIGMAREGIGLAIAQEQLASRWAGNSAKPSGILTTDQKLSKEAADRIAASWKEQSAGMFNAGKTAILEQGLKWQPLAMTSQDMEFIASRQYQLAEIARVFRVPLHMLGELSRTTGNSITQQAQEYLNYSLSTWIKLWETRMAFTFDLDPDEMYVDFNVDELLRADIATRYAAHRVALGGTGWMTMNEIRSTEGLPDVDGGDTVFRPVNTAPVDSDVFAGQADPADPTVPDDINKGLDLDPNAPGVGSDQTGEGAEGGGRPAKKDIAHT
jgi:HK97 family phage portal protein